MQKYLFVLGRNWRLALAEIDHMLRTEAFKGYITDYSTNVAIVEFESYDEQENLDKVADLMVRLGSVQKIGIMYDFVDIELFTDAFPLEMEGNRSAIYPAREYLEGVLNDLLLDVFPEMEDEKVFVANSIYPVSFNDPYYRILIQHFLQFTNKYLTKTLKEKGARKALYFKYPIEKIQNGSLNPIFPHHFFRYELYKPYRSEILYCMTEEGIYIGKTYTVSDSNFQKLLDEERPVTDFRQTIPPKFAKTLISFLGLEPPLHTRKVLDPFCGLGTILQFGYMTGCEMHGADIKQDHVNASRKNLKFTAAQLQKNLSKKYLKKHIVHSSIDLVADKFKPNSFDGIATEPLLYPVFEHFPEDQGVEDTIDEMVKPLYKSLIEQSSYLLKEGACLALVAPVIFRKHNKINIPIEEMAQKNGLQVLNLLNSERIFDSPREELTISNYNFPSILDSGSKRLSREFFLLKTPKKP